MANDVKQVFAGAASITLIGVKEMYHRYLSRIYTQLR